MNLFRNFLEKLFGGGPPRQKPADIQPETGQVNDYLARWQKEKEESTRKLELQLKNWIIKTLKERGPLPFSWESGNDEAFLSFLDSNNERIEDFEDLEEYIILKLDIPDAGEFAMTGNGTLYIGNGLVRAKYSSIFKETIDYDEENDKEIYGNVEQNSDDLVLFSIT